MTVDGDRVLAVGPVRESDAAQIGGASNDDEIVNAADTAGYRCDGARPNVQPVKRHGRDGDENKLLNAGESLREIKASGGLNVDGIRATLSVYGLAGSKVVANTPDQIAILLQGKNAMPSWKGLSDVELAAVATYTKNSFGNAGGAVQPAEFRAARK